MKPKTEKEIRKEIESLVREMSELHSVEIKCITPCWSYTMGGEAQLIDMHYDIAEGV